MWGAVVCGACVGGARWCVGPVWGRAVVCGACVGARCCRSEGRWCETQGLRLVITTVFRDLRFQLLEGDLLVLIVNLDFN